MTTIGLYWNSFGLLGVSALISFWLMAAFVYRAGPGRAENRRLALLFLVEGTSVGTCTGLIMFMGEATEAYVVRFVSAVALVLIPVVYLWFLSTLDTPLVRPYASPWGRAVLGLLAVASVALVFGEPARFVGEPVNTWYARWDVPYGPWGILAFKFMGIVGLFALGAAMHAFARATPGTLRRQQIKAFAIAFGMRDVLYAFFIFGVLPNIAGDRIWGIVWRQGAPLYTFAFLGVLGYGILKTQLFDIDLKVKWAVQKSTVIAVFATAFLVVSEIVERSLGVQGEAFGVAAAVAVGLVFRRVEGVAGRLADRLMPGVGDTEEWRAARKRDVYRASFESALRSDETLTMRERALLDAFREQLGLSPTEAGAIERDAQAAARPA